MKVELNLKKQKKLVSSRDGFGSCLNNIFPRLPALGEVKVSILYSPTRIRVRHECVGDYGNYFEFGCLEQDIVSFFWPARSMSNRRPSRITNVKLHSECSDCGHNLRGGGYILSETFSPEYKGKRFPSNSKKRRIVDMF